jgi:hypothetical protein
MPQDNAGNQLLRASDSQTFAEHLDATLLSAADLQSVTVLRHQLNYKQYQYHKICLHVHDLHNSTNINNDVKNNHY